MDESAVATAVASDAAVAPGVRRYDRDLTGRRVETLLMRVFCPIAPAILLIPDHGPLGLLRFVFAGAALLTAITAPPSVLRHLRIPLPLLFLCGWAALSIVWSVDVYASKKRVLALLVMSIVGWVAGSMLPGPRLLDALSLFAKVLIVISYLEILFAPGWAGRTAVDGAPGYRGSFQHKNALGMFAWIAIVVFVSRGRKGWKLWGLAAFGLVVLSRSSTALAALATVGGVAVFFAAFRWIEAGLRRTFIVLSAVFGIVTGLSVLFLDPALLTAVLGRDATFTGRTRIWSAVLQAIGRRPWIGHGFGGIWDDPTPASERIWAATGFRAYHAHQGYLDFWLQLGIVGFLGLLVLLGSSVARSAPWLRRMRRDAWMPLILIGLMMTAFAESEPFFNGGWAFVALLCAAIYRNSRPIFVPRLRPSAAAVTWADPPQAGPSR